MRTAVVAGALATKAGNGGNAWSRLGWIAGLRAVGFDCWFVEQLPPGGDTPGALAWFDDLTTRHGLVRRSVLLDADGVVRRGTLRRAGDVVDRAALVVDISGHLGAALLAQRSGPAVFLDDDPGFTQAWAADGETGSRLAGHDVFFTYGTNIGTPGCPIPTVGCRWHPVVPPVAMGEWPVVPVGQRDRFTTVGTWRGPFGGVEIGGVAYGLKVHEFRKVIDLPHVVPACFELALDIHPAEAADHERLRAGGWRLADPKVVAASPSRYRSWIQASAAEFSVAQGVYVGTASGWVSDRTACYLASGRPAVVQDTGAGRSVPTGDGLLTFTDRHEAVAMVTEVLGNYEHHARAARKIALEWFDATLVARQVCEQAGVRL